MPEFLVGTSDSVRVLRQALVDMRGQPSVVFEIANSEFLTIAVERTARAAICAAERIGADELRYRGWDGKVHRVARREGSWGIVGGPSLDDLQHDLDSINLRAILARARLRDAIGPHAPELLEANCAMADAYAYRSIQAPRVRATAARRIACAARRYRAYRGAIVQAVRERRNEAVCRELSRAVMGVARLAAVWASLAPAAKRLWSTTAWRHACVRAGARQ